MTENYNDVDDDSEKMSTVRTGVIVGAIAASAILLGLGAVYLFTGGEIFNSNTLEDEEIESIDNTVSSFLMTAGNFGVLEDEYTAEDYHDIDDAYRGYAGLENFHDLFLLRDESYINTRDDYIASTSSLYYDDGQVENWDVEDEIIENRNFIIEPSSINISEMEIVYDPDRDDNEIDSSSDNRIVDVSVDWVSEEKVRREISSAPQSDWDGSLAIRSREYNISVNIMLSEISEDNWKVDSISGLRNNQVLSTWNSPTSFEYTANFEDRGTISPSPPFRVLQETADGYEDSDGNIISEENINEGDHLVSSGFYNYCLEDMPDEYGDPSEFGYEEQRNDDGSCTWLLDEPAPEHPTIQP